MSIPAVDPSRALLVFTMRHAATDPRCGLVRGRLMANNEILFSRWDPCTGSDNRVEIEYQVAEFSSGVSVQRVSASLEGGGAQALVPILPVALSRSFVISSSENLGGVYNANDAPRVWLYDETTVAVETDYPEGGRHEIQVVEMDGALVQHGSFSMGVVDVQTEVSFAEVDPARSVVLTSFGVSYASQPPVGAGFLLATFLSPGSVEITRSTSGVSVDGRYSVVQFPPSVLVQQDVAHLIPGDPDVNVPLAVPVLESKTVSLCTRNSRSSVGSAGAIGEGWATVEQTGPDNVKVQRRATAYEADVAWCAVTF
ncbi:MAG: hypothetical protein AB2A00_20630 [Myxococcota bacterium]